MEFIKDIYRDVRDAYGSSLSNVSNMAGNRPLPGSASDTLGAVLATPPMLAAHWIGGADIHNPNSKRDPRTRHVEIPDTAAHQRWEYIQKKSQHLAKSAADSTSHKSKIPFVKNKMPPKKGKKRTKKPMGPVNKPKFGPRLPRALARRRAAIRASPRKSRPGKVSFGNRKRLIQRSSNPPVAQGYILNSGSRLDFFQSKRPGCMGIKGRVRVGVLTSGGTSGAVLTCTPAGTPISVLGFLPIAPQFSNLYPPVLANFSGLFQRYSLNVRFSYVPSCATSTVGTLAWMIVRDAAAINDVFGGSSLGSSLTVQQMSSMATLREGPLRDYLSTPWIRPQKGDDMKYVSGQFATNTTTIVWTQSSAGLRDQIQYVLCFSLAAAQASQAYGDFFMDYEMELCDVLAQSINNSLSTRYLRIAEEKKRADAVTFLSEHLDDVLAFVDSKKKDEEPEEEYKRSSSKSSNRSVKSDKGSFLS